MAIPLLPLIAATTAVQAFGLIQQYNLARTQAELQKEQLDLQAQMNRLQTEIKKREARAAARKKQAALTVQAAARGTIGTSVFEGQAMSLDTMLDSVLRSYTEMMATTQQQLKLQEEQLKLKTPTSLDLFLGLTGTAASGVTKYYTTKSLLGETATKSVFDDTIRNTGGYKDFDIVNNTIPYY